ncbi:MAG: hypothetical protein EOO22_28325 [Comamonadaceae bacterium]|nr:MAG: hypothetical protein EOO22_28325 [Comamonadaceae bacterium]
MVLGGWIFLRRWLRSVACLLALCWAVMAPAAATPSPSEDKLIQNLIQRVETHRDMVFLRNGEEHSAAEAARHMREKYDYFRSEIVTAEDFIQRCATRSEMTKTAYKIRLKTSGAVRSASDFMHEELKALRQR